MTPVQLQHFRDKLNAERVALLAELAAMPAREQVETGPQGDQTDQSSAETDRDLIALNRARAQKMLGDVDRALARIENGTFGICEETGRPIGLKRLEAQPTATLSIEAQEARERVR